MGKRLKKSKRRKIYEKYLWSGHWRQLKAERRKLVGNICEQCGKPGIHHGHHKRYRKDLSSCTIHDIVMLCEDCHFGLHRAISKERKERKKELKSNGALMHAELDAEMDAAISRCG